MRVSSLFLKLETHIYTYTYQFRSHRAILEEIRTDLKKVRSYRTIFEEVRNVPQRPFAYDVTAAILKTV